MSSEIKKVVIRELLAKYGDAINMRGVIFGPSDDAQYEGKVAFNIIDRRHQEFGRHIWHFSIDLGGNLSFSREKNEERKRKQ